MKFFTSCLVLSLLFAASCGAHGESGRRELLQYGTDSSSSNPAVASGSGDSGMLASPVMAPMMMTPAPAPAPMDMAGMGVTAAGRKLLGF